MENISTNYDIKYRFDTMDSILGNKKTVNFVNTLLKNGNYPNVTIISGPTGAGKSSLAYIIAKTLQCEQGQGRYICNQCKTCQELSKTLYNKGEGKSALGVMTFDMGKNNDVEYINDLAQTIQTGDLIKNKILIIEELQRTDKRNQEALLRVLEYIKDNVYVIITTTDTYKIQKAIQSRSTPIRMTYPNEKDLLEFTKQIATNENIKITIPQMKDLIRYENNNTRTILKGLQNVKFSGSHGIEYLINKKEEESLKFIEYFECVQNDITETILYIENLEEPIQFLRDLKYFIKDVIKMKYTSVKGTKTYKERIQSVIMKTLTDKNLFEIMDNLNQVRLNTNDDAEVTLLVLAYKLNELLYYQVTQPDAMPAQEAAETKTSPKLLNVSQEKQQRATTILDDILPNMEF